MALPMPTHAPQPSSTNVLCAPSSSHRIVQTNRNVGHGDVEIGFSQDCAHMHMTPNHAHSAIVGSISRDYRPFFALRLMNGHDKIPLLVSVGHRCRFLNEVKRNGVTRPFVFLGVPPGDIESRRSF